MPPKFGNLKPREVIRALHLKHPTKPGRVTVPYHERFDSPKHIVKSIVRQAGLSNSEFFVLLER